MYENVDELECYESVTTDEKDDYESTGLRDFEHEGLLRITEQHIREVQRELCLIKLCWPEVDLGKDLYLKTLPNSYCTVSGKEKVLAWYAENFRQQFHAKYPDRRPLLLVCDNECGVQKFVSTAIRRSTLPYPELYTWQGCGKFVSDYIEYEPLDKALGMPRQLRSPTWMQKFQKGNCFELATFLTSLLLGEGYNAFVVSGYASKEQTLCDSRKITCPYLPQPEQPACSPVRSVITKYKLKPPPDFASEFLSGLENEKEKRLLEKLRQQEQEQQRLIEELEQPEVDEYWGHRTHAWVAILPELGGMRDQEIPGPLFIEPSTGVSYKTADDETGYLYFGVESIWNDQNYWVNMQRTNSCENIVWDLMKAEFWEHVLPGEPWTMRGTGEEIEEDAILRQEKHLDMPFSYVKEIIISDQEFEKRYPNGTKTILYKKTKVELYAPYVQPDGLIQKVTTYDDYDYMMPVEIYENYANRSDHLVECRRNTNDDSVVDYYKRGRSDQCKEHRYFANGPNTVDSERILDFYHVARFDGLSRIEMHPTYLTQRYENRDDLLYHRHVQFSREKNIPVLYDIHYRHISKIIEQFGRDERVKPSKNIAIREFAVDDNEIRLTYHYHPGQYSRASRTYIKPPLAERGERLVLNPAMTQGYNPLNEPDKSLELFYELDTQLKEEDQSISHVRRAEVEVSNFLKTRGTEYLTPQLSISVYNKHRDLESLTELFMTRAQSEKAVTEEVDYLKPYLARMGNPTEVPKSQAQLIRYECLSDYKQLLVRRANKILRKFDEHAQELEKLQALLTQNEDITREEEDQLLDKMNEINFNLQTLESRLNRHRDLVPTRYKMLMVHLEESRHLSALQQWRRDQRFEIISSDVH